MTDDLPLRPFTVWRLSDEVWGDVWEMVQRSEKDGLGDGWRIVWQGMARHAGEARRLAAAAMDAAKGDG